MSYTSYHDHRGYLASGVPFVAYTESFRTTGETIYDVIVSFCRFVSRTVRAAGARKREYRTVQVVSGLSDQTLNDIGVQRSEIRYIARCMASNPGTDYRAFTQW